jgi:hypothetical protein
VAISGGLFDTLLDFDGGVEADVQMATVAASGAWLASARWTFRASLGAIVGGSLETGVTDVHEVRPGILGAVGVDYRAVLPEGAIPFVDLSLAVGASRTRTVARDGGEASYLATDMRAGVRVGWNIGDVAFPYLAVRAFGGPVLWRVDDEERVGTDRYHYQAALGAVGAIGPLALFVEWSGLGERAISTGVGYSF